MSGSSSKVETYDLVVVGGGAAGFFGAICCAEQNPSLRIIILEKTTKVLSKVRVSGGGRCNVTHSCFNPFRLAAHYPRGERALKELFKKFDASSMVEWLKSHGVDIKTEEDGRIFPSSNSSQTIIDCFLRNVAQRGIRIEAGVAVEKIEKVDGKFHFVSPGKIFIGRYALIATGGSPSQESYKMLANLGHSIIPPIPSLFTFNDSEKRLTDLMGVSVENAEVRIQGTKLIERGPILLTHWGLSGPAVIRLSAWAAEHLHDRQYIFVAVVNWTEFQKEAELREAINQYRSSHPKKRISATALFGIPSRLWERLILMAEIEDVKPWGELSQKSQNKLIENIYRFEFKIRGKTTFKEEFVTCGGVDLKEIDLNVMESKRVAGLFFAGEVLNIDGETGGFNFQSAWTTSFIAASEIASRCRNAQ